MILYNDPEQDAPLGPNKVYPEYVYLPETGVQYGSIFEWGLGDPLTPGLPSLDGVFRVTEDKVNLPKIPAVAMPYGDVVELLNRMKGVSLQTTKYFFYL